MSEEHTTDINLLDYPPEINRLEYYKGSGRLQYRESTWDGNFALVRLLNGRLRFVFMLHDYRENSDRFIDLYSLSFEGVAEDRSIISVAEIHFDMRRSNGNTLNWICTGYAESASRHIDIEPETVSVHCNLTNYALYQRREEVNFHLNGFDIRLLRQPNENNIGEHAVAYHHASLPTTLVINNISANQVEAAINTLQNITSSLSIACRGHVFITATYIVNEENMIFDSKFEEPAFTDRKWSQPLIPSQNIEDFILAVEATERSREQNLEIAYIVDHYLQALTIRSIWPQAVGIFTAMETLKAAFFAQEDNSEEDGERNIDYVYWVVPEDKFTSNDTMVNEILAVLTEHNSRFENLSRDERSSLKDQIKHGLKRRSYRTQLKRMLNMLEVEYDSSDLQVLIETRNRLIHEGTPVSASTPVDEYHATSRRASEKVKRAIGLFERALLAYLNYDGPKNLLYENSILH